MLSYRLLLYIYIRIAADSFINNTISHPLPVILEYEDGLKIHHPNKENKTMLGILVFMYIVNFFQRLSIFTNVTILS